MPDEFALVDLERDTFHEEVVMHTTEGLVWHDRKTKSPTHPLGLITHEDIAPPGLTRTTVNGLGVTRTTSCAYTARVCTWHEPQPKRSKCPEPVNARV